MNALRDWIAGVLPETPLDVARDRELRARGGCYGRSPESVARRRIRRRRAVPREAQPAEPRSSRYYNRRKAGYTHEQALSGEGVRPVGRPRTVLA